MYEFNWRTETDSEDFKSMTNLIKYNGGNWKSEKQAKFMLERKANTRTKENLLVNFGITTNEENQKVIEVEAWMRQSIYGSRGIVPYTVFFLVDDKGIKAQYRIHYRGNMRDGCTPNTSKTETKWSRES